MDPQSQDMRSTPAPSSRICQLQAPTSSSANQIRSSRPSHSAGGQVGVTSAEAPPGSGDPPDWKPRPRSQPRPAFGQSTSATSSPACPRPLRPLSTEQPEPGEGEQGLPAHVQVQRGAPPGGGTRLPGPGGRLLPSGAPPRGGARRAFQGPEAGCLHPGPPPQFRRATEP